MYKPEMIVPLFILFLSLSSYAKEDLILSEECSDISDDMQYFIEKLGWMDDYSSPCVISYWIDLFERGQYDHLIYTIIKVRELALSNMEKFCQEKTGPCTLNIPHFWMEPSYFDRTLKFYRAEPYSVDNLRYIIQASGLQYGQSIDLYLSEQYCSGCKEAIRIHQHSSQ